MKFDRTVPRDDIGFEVLSHYNAFFNLIRTRPHGRIQAHNFLAEKMRELQGENGGKLSRRAIERLSKVFIRQFDNHVIFMQYRFHKKNLGRLSMEDFEMKILTVWWRSTPRGTMYFTEDTGRDFDLLFPAHFFDRLIERSEMESTDRNLAIGKFLWKIMQRHTNRFFIKNLECALFCDEGAGLGFGRILTDRQGELAIKAKSGNMRFHKVLYLKTFVSRDMLTRSQLREESEADFMPPLNFTVVFYPTHDNYSPP